LHVRIRFVISRVENKNRQAPKFPRGTIDRTELEVAKSGLPEFHPSRRGELLVMWSDAEA